MVGLGLGVAAGEIAVAVGIGVAGSPPQAASMANVATNQTVATRVHHLPNTPSTISCTGAGYPIIMAKATLAGPAISRQAQRIPV